MLIGKVYSKENIGKKKKKKEEDQLHNRTNKRFGNSGAPFLAKSFATSFLDKKKHDSLNISPHELYHKADAERKSDMGRFIKMKPIWFWVVPRCRHSGGDQKKCICSLDTNWKPPNHPPPAQSSSDHP